MTDLERQTEIEKLPNYLKDLALEVQDKNDEYEKIKKQLQALKEVSENLNVTAQNLLREIDADKQMLVKITKFISQNPNEDEENLHKVEIKSKQLIEQVKTNQNALRDLQLENEVILQDIMILSEDEIKVKAELTTLNQTLKLNLDFSIQNNN